MKYSINPKYFNKINSDYVRYAIEDVHNAIIKIDRYISNDKVKLNYSNVQMVVRNEITEPGSYFVTQALNTLSKVEESGYSFDNFMVGPFVEDFKKQLKIVDLVLKRLRLFLELNIRINLNKNKPNKPCYINVCWVYCDLITQLHLRIISLNYTLSRPRQIKIKAKVSAQLSAIKEQIYMETRDKLMSLTQSDKTQQWLMDKSSNQDDIQQLQQQFSQQLDQQYNALLADEKAKLDQYVEVHQGLESLKEEIESEPITLNIDKLPDIKATMLERAKNDEHSDKIEKLFDRLEQALNGTNRLYTQLSLIGTRTHRITTKILIFKAYLKQSNIRFYLQNLRRCIQSILNRLNHQLQRT